MTEEMIESLSKKELRKVMLAKRNALLQSYRDVKSQNLVETLVGLDVVQNADILLLYSAIGSEVNVTNIMSHLPDKQFAFPRVCKDEMDFYLINSLTDFSPGAFGVLEPNSYCEKIATEDADVVCIVPGVAFDKKGARMGYGKGYYDKYFSLHPGIYKIGVAFEEQVLETLAVEEHDIRMDLLIT